MVKLGFIANKELASQCEGNMFCQVVFNVDSYKDAAAQIKNQTCDFVITELVTAGVDGFMLLDEINQLPNAPKVVIATNLSSESLIVRAFNLGAFSYLIKPIDVNYLLQTLTKKLGSGTVKKPVASHKALDEKLSNIFISVGIPAHIKGFQFLREGIKLVVDNPSIINSITKKLYPAIAQNFSTSPSKVERAIRHAIEVAWNRGKIENINSLFGVKVYSSNEKPTNGEFIALLADKMLLEYIY